MLGSSSYQNAIGLRCRAGIVVSAALGLLLCVPVGAGAATAPSPGVPYLVKNINSSSSSSTPRELTAVGSLVFFSAKDGPHGRELWKSDGTAAGTKLVRDIASGHAGSGPRELTNVAGTLFFTANDGTHGDELWRSDGTAAGTKLVRDIASGPMSSFPQDLTAAHGLIFFWTEILGPGGQVTGGSRLWRSDGTAHGTIVLKSVTSAIESKFLRLTKVGDRLFFVILTWKAPCQPSTGCTRHSFLWKSNGTVGGTNRVVPTDFRDEFGEMAAVGGTAYFVAPGLRVSDGTAAGTRKVSKLGGEDLTNVGGVLFFESGDQLLKSDGTGPGTVVVKAFASSQFDEWSLADLTSVHGKLFFTAYHGDDNVWRLWSSDGSGPGTQLVKDIDPTGNAGPADLTALGTTLYFDATDGVHGRELWMSDGTEPGTNIVADISATRSSSPAQMAVVGGTLYFTADDGVHGRELWHLVP